MKQVIFANSIAQAVAVGTLVELASDYRTAGAVRAALPPNTSYAMTLSAFNQHIRAGLLAELNTRTEAFCRDLHRALQARTGEPASGDFIISQQNPNGQINHHPLKLIWLAASQSWVVSLPDEEVRVNTGRP